MLIRIIWPYVRASLYTQNTITGARTDASIETSLCAGACAPGLLRPSLSLREHIVSKQSTVFTSPRLSGTYVRSGSFQPPTIKHFSNLFPSLHTRICFFIYGNRNDTTGAHKMERDPPLVGPTQGN